MQRNSMNKPELAKCIIILFFPALIATTIQAQQKISSGRVDGYRGIWFELGQKSAYGDKYSGGLGTYTAKHVPLALYDSVSNKTYFVYGGTSAAKEKQLLCMIGYYDHQTGNVPKPVVVCNKHGIDDPHDNPSILMDDEGYLWVFVSGRGKRRPGFKYRSIRPYSIDTFQQVSQEEMTYPQPWYVTGDGYFHFFTKYTGRRELYYETSKDGINWSDDQKLAGIKIPGDEYAGHYQISACDKNKLGTFFNWHPNGNVDKRTNLYYLESSDFGQTWHTVNNIEIQIPVTSTDDPCLVAEYFSKAKNVYLKDMSFDKNGNPIALFIVSNGHEPGPDNGLRHWKIAHWKGKNWVIHDVTTSDHNYDMGSLYIEDHFWWVIAPTSPGPQPWGTGGEVVIWESSNEGATWHQVMQVTHNSERNHAYMRKPVNAQPDFFGFWADGNPDDFSISNLYFMNKAGKVFQLPYTMDSTFYNVRSLKDNY